MRWIYLSPHLDDAALSAGGWIYDQIRAGNSVEIWTVMCGVPPTTELSPFAQALHYQWGMTTAEEVVHGRRREDVHAAAVLGATTHHFDFPDCIYRQGRNGDWLYGDVFVDPHPDEADLPARIAETISARLKPDDNLLCQFSIGKHADHILVRRAAELLTHPLRYVVDIPYLFNTPEQLPPHTAGMKATVERVSEAGLASWQEAIEAYASQISSLFDSPEAMREQIRQYWAENRGIRLWQPA
ncbi:MAG: PIG-L family deacetylase [Anaerolineales bacterium]|nr:PIG-L family deacetylase [Anaerolineales bacterium]